MICEIVLSAPFVTRRKLITLLFVLLDLVQRAYSIECRQCEKQFGSCDDGVCTGKTCVLIEAMSSQFRKVVKTCSPQEQPKSECFVAYPDGIESVHCHCIYDLCNSDEEIKKSGLIKIRHEAGTHPVSDSDNNDRNKRTNSENSRTLAISTNSIILLTFLCFFVSAAFSLLIIHTMC